MYLAYHHSCKSSPQNYIQWHKKFSHQALS